jgi:hypothetical protein
MSPLGGLNTDVLEVVFEHLDHDHTRALAAVAQSTKRWRAIALPLLHQRKAAYFAGFDSNSCTHLYDWLVKKRTETLMDALEHHCCTRQVQLLAEKLVMSIYAVADLAPEATMLRILDIARTRHFNANREGFRFRRGDPFMTTVIRNYSIYARDPGEESVRRQWIVKLLQWGANPTVVPDYQWAIHQSPPPLFWVLYNPRMVGLLLEHSKYPLKLNQRLWRYNLGDFGPGEFKHTASMSPLMWLASGRRIGHPEIIPEETAIESAFLLLEAYPNAPELRADPRVRDEDGRTAASIARSLERHLLADVLEQACERLELEVTT